MGQRKRQLLPNLKEFFSLSLQFSFDLPRITIINNNSCHIENHFGLVTYSTTLLVVKGKTGYIEITGSSFVISMMFKEELFLEGTIDSIQFLTEL